MLVKILTVFVLWFVGCCIYEKPKMFGESSDEEDDDHDCTNHCRGHKSKKDFRRDHDHNPDDPSHDQPDGYAAGSKHFVDSLLSPISPLHYSFM